MKKYFIIILLCLVAFFSYFFFSVCRYKDVREDFLNENPGCAIVSVHPYGQGKKNIEYIIRYRRKGEKEIYETKWFFQKSRVEKSWQDIDQTAIKDVLD